MPSLPFKWFSPYPSRPSSPAYNIVSFSGRDDDDSDPDFDAHDRPSTDRDDPLANVQSPQLVVCNRCGASIKLSLKSAYDPFHWSRHRERCLKRPDAVVQSMRDASDKVLSGPPLAIYKHLPKRSI